ncbi:Crp/Fnr family transcriptional regulator [Salipiger mucosus]|uniref:CrpK, Fnr-type transcriptional regulator n=1 Tax=Salipiger mucosus DSM 16094 TaxID=1123237 RepID=S9QQM2_9RHOB|nr:Crp/Fnr family transcriptional regulator [Salipiger mucosus]EPX83691.1 crpK, Fnr-type transcriptional regulator [Salipiger mucosus DSM 16094]
MTTRDSASGGCPCRLSQLHQLSELDPATLAELESLCRLRRFDHGQTVVYDGDTPDVVACVRSGVLRMQKTLSDGRQHIVGLLVEGDMFGRVFNGPMHFSIEAASAAEVCTFPRDAFEAMMFRAPDLERVVLLNLLTELDRARDWMILLTSHKISGRVAGFLLVLCARFAGIDHLVQLAQTGLDVKIPISRADLAHLLGTRPESLSRAFHALADAGSIEVLKPDLIRILDIEALTEAAGDDDLATHPNLRELVQVLQRRT